MNDKDKLKIVIEGLLKIKEIKDLSITLDTTLSSLKLDSLDIVELQIYLEENFEVDTADSSGPIKTVKDLIDLIK